MKKLLDISGQYTPKYWAFTLGIMFGGIAQEPRIDFQIGPFLLSMKFVK